jgi:hypothetical protein
MIREQAWFDEYQKKNTESLIDLASSGDFFTRLHAFAALAFRVDTDPASIAPVTNALRDRRNDHPKIFGIPMPFFLMVALSEANGPVARSVFFERLHELSEIDQAEVMRLVAPEFGAG